MKTQARNQDCDKCGKHTAIPGKIRRLNLGGNSGAYFCRACWVKEMKWRTMRNKTLSGKAKFPILKWPGV